MTSEAARSFSTLSEHSVHFQSTSQSEKNQIMRDVMLHAPDIDLPGDGDPASAGDARRMGPARLLAERLMRQVVLGRAARRSGRDGSEGARGPVGPARAAVELVTLEEVKGDGKTERLTPLGYRTARVRLPRALAALEEADARRQVAVRYCHLAELVHGVPGCAGLLNGGSGRVSDGGAVWRLAVAEELRAIRGRIGPGVVLVPVYAAEGRRRVTVRDVVDGVCLQGLEVKGVLAAHGWAAYGGPVKLLTAALLGALTEMAEAQKAS